MITLSDLRNLLSFFNKQSTCEQSYSELDDISVHLLKEAAPIVVFALTLIINLSIVTGIFPDEWKHGRVYPFFKDSGKADPNNYRPISFLSVVRKLIERVAFCQFYGYFN